MSSFRTLITKTPTTTTTRLIRPFSPVNHIRLSSSGVHYNPPTGHLFGEKPPPTGQKRQREDWESIYYWGMGGGMALGAVLIYYKPDTSLEGWARKEAEAKLAAAGETPSYVKS